MISNTDVIGWPLGWHKSPDGWHKKARPQKKPLSCPGLQQSDHRAWPQRDIPNTSARPGAGDPAPRWRPGLGAAGPQSAAMSPSSGENIKLQPPAHPASWSLLIKTKHFQKL